ncbi:MAG: hypothetical protein A2277_13895 [Desulfobacterales bacterium RIFOXYA12_FULL_46_15]|nr:MAG: hypothetical protein A2277_13895 [Desulfobacterales bacterium RIFOXYA12_FULL_46_15]
MAKFRYNVNSDKLFVKFNIIYLARAFSFSSDIQKRDRNPFFKAKKGRLRPFPTIIFSIFSSRSRGPAPEPSQPPDPGKHHHPGMYGGMVGSDLINHLLLKKNHSKKLNFHPLESSLQG